MHRQVGDVRVAYAEHGAGVPLVALHGAGVDHRELEGALEPVLAAVPGIRRLYPDLPGSGGTAAPPRLASNDDVVDVLVDLADDLVGDEPLLLVGHSLGGYLARAVADRRRDRVAGLALLCPAGRASRDVPEHAVVRSEAIPPGLLADDDVAGFEQYLVVRTPETARRYRDRVLPGTRAQDEAALGRILGGGWTLRHEPGTDGEHPYPTLVVAGRQDSSVGWAAAADLLALYPRATLAVVDGAGHALPHERPDVLAALLRDWLDRCREGRPAGGPAPR